MKIIRETIVAGKTIIQSYKASTRITSEKGRKRNARTNPTPEAARKINLKNAVKNLTAIMNHNFQGGDYHLTLTYANEAGKQQARKDRTNFLRNMKNYCAKNGVEWKWVAVTEYENHRIHHHIVCSAVDPEVINEKWKHGWVNIKQMDASGNYYRLAEYLIKETEKTFRNPDSANKKRYSSSGNIVIPQSRKEEVSSRLMQDDPQPYKGYYIDQDTVNRYDHAILGVECLEFIQVSLDDNSRIKRWNRGKKSKREKRYAEHWPEQIELW